MMISQRLTAVFHMPFLFRLMLLLAMGLTGCAQTRQTDPAEARQKDQLTQEEHTNMGVNLIGAAERGNTAEVRRLLAEGAPINAQDSRGRTAALAATHGG